jgi:CRP-like cAMP-binding protein
MTTTLDLLSAHPFLADLPVPWLTRLTYQARRSVHNVGSRIIHEGSRADRFWLIRDGAVAIDFNVQGRGAVVIEEIGNGEVVGWSWLLPPYRWHFGAVAVRQTLAIEFDARGVQGVCEQEPALGYELTRRFSLVLADRLQAARGRLVELYGYPLAS